MPTINVEPGFDQKLQEIADILAKSRKVVVITGAGISTNCGIPDFRSENGLYSLIQAQYEAVAGITPFSDGIDDRPVKRRRVDCVTTSIPTKTTEDRCDPQLPNRHSHSSRIKSTNLPMEENIVQPIFEPPLKPKFDKKKFDKKTLPAEAQEPSTRRQLRSYSLVAKDVTTLPPCGGFVKETPPKSTSIPPKETNVRQRKFRSLKSVQSTDIATDLRTNPSNEKALSLKRAPAVVPKASDHPRRLRSSRSLEKPDATLKPEPVSLFRKTSTRTLQRKEEKVSTLRRSLRSSVTSDLKKESLSLENCIKEKSNPTKESTSILEKDTSCIEVILPQGLPKRPLQSDLEADSHIHVDIDEPLSLQTSSISASTRCLPNLKGKDLFDAIIWTNPLTTSIFYTFVSNLRQKILSGIKETTPTHKFIRVLRDGGRLVRNYTQNIDLLEAREGLCTDLERGPGSRARFTSKNQKEAQPTMIPGGGPHDRGVEVVHLHGKLDGLRCGLCARYANWDEDNRHRATLAGEAPECPWCKETSAHREGRGRRSLSVGRLRPDIVLYGEEHPSAHLVGPIVTHDLSLGPDVLLILGTSLRVHGLKFMVKEFAKAVHGKGGKVIFINKSKPPESIWAEVIDYWVEWDCDAWVGDLQERRKDIWLPQGTPSKGPLQEEKEKPIPKNPTATRVDVTNGAHHTLKIMERLGRLSGRLPEFGKSLNRHQELTYKTTTEDESKERKRPLTPRQASVRLNKENGAYLVFEIIANLRRLSGNPQTTGKMKLVRAPLASTSANLPSKRLGTRQASPTREKLSPYYLPTPPNSDQAMPHMTRETDILSG